MRLPECASMLNTPVMQSSPRPLPIPLWTVCWSCTSHDRRRTAVQPASAQDCPMHAHRSRKHARSASLTSTAHEPCGRFGFSYMTRFDAGPGVTPSARMRCCSPSTATFAAATWDAGPPAAHCRRWVLTSRKLCESRSEVWHTAHSAGKPGIAKAISPWRLPIASLP